jgi:hypothetical protein
MAYFSRGLIIPGNKVLLCASNDNMMGAEIVRLGYYACNECNKEANSSLGANTCISRRKRYRARKTMIHISAADSLIGPAPTRRGEK